MKNKFNLPALIIIFVICIIGSAAEDAVAVKPLDSLRVGTIIKGIKTFAAIAQDSILPNLNADEKKSLKGMVSDLNKMIKKSEPFFKDTMLADFNKLSPDEKKMLTEIDAQEQKIKGIVPEKSVHHHLIALAHLPLYKAAQELRPDGRMPLLATYVEAYDPNTTTNKQVTLTGAYLNFYLEYKINVGGIVMGPDIVDPDRVVFTFPEKLLEGISAPDYIEVKAAPQMQTGEGRSKKFVDGAEQHVWVLVYPVKK